MPASCIRQTLNVTCALALLMVIIHPKPSMAQTELASVSGRVTDQSGATVAGAEVEIKNADTNVSQVTTTNGDGFYVMTSLKPGNYVMNVRKAQFRTISLTGIVLNVQQTMNRNFVLEVGSTTESVTVTAESTGVNTESSAISTVVDRQFVENLPMNGRTFQTLIELTP